MSIDPYGHVIDKLVQLFNPADDEDFVAVLTRAAGAIETMECSCVEIWASTTVHACRRCRALGRERDRRLTRD